MSLLLERLWPALAGAMALGLVFAGFGGPGRSTASAGRPLGAGLLLLLLCGWILSWTGIVPGASGLWLDIGLCLATAYAGGALAGAFLHRVFVRRRADDSAGPTAGSTASRVAGPDEPGPDGAPEPSGREMAAPSTT